MMMGVMIGIYHNSDTQMENGNGKLKESIINPTRHAHLAYLLPIMVYKFKNWLLKDGAVETVPEPSIKNFVK